jgi:hypothetical protein
VFSLVEELYGMVKVVFFGKRSSMSKNYLIAHLLLDLVKLVNKLEVKNSDIVVESFTMVVLVNSLLIEGYKL